MRAAMKVKPIASRETVSWRIRTASSLFTEDAYVDLAILFRGVDVDREVMELLDQFLEILWLDLRKIDGNTLLTQSVVGLVERLRRNQPRQADAGAQQLHGDADVDLGGAVGACALSSIYDHAKILRRGLRTGAGTGR